MNNRQKLNALIQGKKSSWRAEAEWRTANEHWLSLSFDIALRILETLEVKGMSQKELADRMDVSPQFINKVLKGKENLSLETVANFSKALGIQLIQVPSHVAATGVYEVDQAYATSETYRQQIFAKNGGKAILELSKKLTYKTHLELTYKYKQTA